MAKAVAKTAARLKKEKMEKLTLLVTKAIELGSTTKSAIAEAVDIHIYELNELFKFNKDVYALYCIRRKTLVDTAADNIEEILKDKTHPQHYQASKYILENYKSDLDGTLEGKDEKGLGGISVSVGGKGDRRPVRISFSSSNSKKD